MKLDYDWSKILDGLGSVASVFNPAVGSSLMVVSDVVDKLLNENDEVLEHNVIGLTRCNEILDEMIENRSIDFEKLEFVSHNLELIENVLSKINKVVR